VPVERKLAILADTLASAWAVPVSTAPVVGPGEDKASSLRAMVVELDERLRGACPERVLARALEYADRRAAEFDPDVCVVVHGDPHPANTLRVVEPRPGAESGYWRVPTGRRQGAPPRTGSADDSAGADAAGDRGVCGVPGAPETPRW